MIRNEDNQDFSLIRTLPTRGSYLGERSFKQLENVPIWSEVFTNTWPTWAQVTVQADLRSTREVGRPLTIQNVKKPVSALSSAVDPVCNLQNHAAVGHLAWSERRSARGVLGTQMTAVWQRRPIWSFFFTVVQKKKKQCPRFFMHARIGSSMCQYFRFWTPVPRTAIRAQSQSARPGSFMCKRGRIRWRSIQLSSGENIQGKPAAQSNHELIHVRETREQDRRHVSICKEEQKDIAGVVFTVIRGRVEARNWTDTKLALWLFPWGRYWDSDGHVTAAVSCWLGMALWRTLWMADQVSRMAIGRLSASFMSLLMNFLACGPGRPVVSRMKGDEVDVWISVNFVLLSLLGHVSWLRQQGTGCRRKEQQRKHPGTWQSRWRSRCPFTTRVRACTSCSKNTLVPLCECVTSAWHLATAARLRSTPPPYRHPGQWCCCGSTGLLQMRPAALLLVQDWTTSAALGAAWCGDIDLLATATRKQRSSALYASLLGCTRWALVCDAGRGAQHGQQVGWWSFQEAVCESTVGRWWLAFCVWLFGEGQRQLAWRGKLACSFVSKSVVWSWTSWALSRGAVLKRESVSGDRVVAINVGMTDCQHAMELLHVAERQIPLQVQKHRMHTRGVHHEQYSLLASTDHIRACGSRAYYSAENQFERFRGVLELISWFEFEFRRCENYFFERFEFLVCSCECAVACLRPRNSISNVVASVTIHGNIK